MKKPNKSNPINSFNLDKYLDKEIVPGLSMREMMKDDEMRDIMRRMIKAELDSVKN